MKVLIAYCSSHGTTTKAALLLKKKLVGDVVVVNLNTTKLQSDLELFDAVIIGGSIHVGGIQGKVKKFMKENDTVLRRKKLGLFVCCMREGEDAKQQLEHVFPVELREHASKIGVFGGECSMSNLNFIEKQLVKRVGNAASKINQQAIEEFAREFNLYFEASSLGV
ncbi:flavodoxin domain-containing protein [Mesobacillus maritimus]|uniref:flavodoxin domain-containing protein n=1 Tax=Mesobacillus maritimus TaxID=1643336 RepID=UPI00203BB6BA|nr:flavodoxin domain-containing protein [Mesobacillus maritimus]MCM3585487.1 flavodoxin domain-containing protein [Mesobacillus maritimus]